MPIPELANQEVSGQLQPFWRNQGIWTLQILKAPLFSGLQMNQLVSYLLREVCFPAFLQTSKFDCYTCAQCPTPAPALEYLRMLFFIPTLKGSIGVSSLPCWLSVSCPVCRQRNSTQSQSIPHCPLDTPFEGQIYSWPLLCAMKILKYTRLKEETRP